jgi:hypothetical protein
MNEPVWAKPGKDGGHALLILARPGAKTDQVVGVEEGRLKVKLKAPARDNLANEALIAFLSKLLGAPKSALEITAGHTARQKTIRVRPGTLPDWRGVEQAVIDGS